MRLTLIASLTGAASLVACTPAAAPPPPADSYVEAQAPAHADVPPAAGACGVYMPPTALASLGGAFTAEAIAMGDDCTRAAVTLAVRDAAGDILYTFSGSSDRLLGFAEATTPDMMRTALEGWAGDGAATEPSTTASLPAWPEGAEGPGDGMEFPFYVADGFDRDTYERTRSEARPMYCHVQGVESMACLSLEPPFAEAIGVQAVPG